MYLEPWWTVESFRFGNWKFQRFSLQEKNLLRIIIHLMILEVEMNESHLKKNTSGRYDPARQPQPSR